MIGLILFGIPSSLKADGLNVYWQKVTTKQRIRRCICVAFMDIFYLLFPMRYTNSKKINSQVAKLVNAATVSTLKKSLKDREYRCYASSSLALATKQIK